MMRAVLFSLILLLGGCHKKTHSQSLDAQEAAREARKATALALHPGAKEFGRSDLLKRDLTIDRQDAIKDPAGRVFYAERFNFDIYRHKDGVRFSFVTGGNVVALECTEDQVRELRGQSDISESILVVFEVTAVQPIALHIAAEGEIDDKLPIGNVTIENPPGQLYRGKLISAVKL